MERKKFSKEEKIFFRERFPRLTRENCRVLLETGNNSITTFGLGRKVYAGITEFETGFFIFLNPYTCLREQRISLVHEILHPHYENKKGEGIWLYRYLCAVYGRKEMSPYSFFPGHGEFFCQHWEEFLNEEAALLIRDDSGLTDYIKGFFKVVDMRNTALHGKRKSVYQEDLNTLKTLLLYA